MCGIAGSLGIHLDRDPEAELHRMGAAIVHRGPDSGGVWLDRDAAVGLVHRRLAVVDLSPTGAQPMQSASGRYVCVFNGEIYNHLEIRRQLEASLGSSHWRGSSDTETLLASIESFGLEQAVRGWVGMFALALWDRQTRTLALVRDRFGEKPLYFGHSGSRFFFGSELKAIRAHSAFSPRIDREALALFFRHNYIPQPHSIFQGIAKLAPGSIAWVQPDSKNVRILAYWSAVEVARSRGRQPFKGSYDEAVTEVRQRLITAVREQTVADVPVGAFLSGGIDSSTVVALMQANSSRRVQTFTIGFGDDRFNEADHAKAVAAHLQTDHTELYLSGEQARELIPQLPRIYDEPFADVSQLPTCFVSQLARRRVTVSLSGDGADELFGGYGRFARAAQLIPWHQRLGVRGRRLVKSLIDSTLFVTGPTGELRLAGGPAGLQSRIRPVGRLAELLSQPDAPALYRSLLSYWKPPRNPVRHVTEPPTEFMEYANWLADGSAQEAVQMLDVITFLPDLVLAKVDRAAMRYSLETRVPMLDHRLAEFVWSLPVQYRANRHAPKRILKDILAPLVPPRLTDRPKMGFSVPIGDWLRGPLRDWAESLLDARLIERQGLLHAEPIRQAWQELLDRRADVGEHLWGVLTFQAWLGDVFPGGDPD